MHYDWLFQVMWLPITNESAFFANDTIKFIYEIEYGVNEQPDCFITGKTLC